MHRVQPDGGAAVRQRGVHVAGPRLQSIGPPQAEVRHGDHRVGAHARTRVTAQRGEEDGEVGLAEVGRGGRQALGGERVMGERGKGDRKDMREGFMGGMKGMQQEGMSQPYYACL